jgi:hypothetical protein
VPGYRIVVLTGLLVAGGAAAQSDPAGFASVIDVPPTVIGFGETLADDTQLNVLPGGEVGALLTVGPLYLPGRNVELNLLGGTILDGLQVLGEAVINVNDGTLVDVQADSGVEIHLRGGTIGALSAISGFEAPTVMTMTGGILGAFFDIDAGARLDYAGGDIDERLEVFAGGTLNIIGNDFELDGTSLAGLAIGVPVEISQRGGALLEGRLANGEGFAFVLDEMPDDELNDVFYPGATVTVTLQPAEVLFRDGFEPGASS